MNPENIVVERLALDELGTFQQFIKKHWKEDHLFAQESSVFDWQHKGAEAYHYMVAKQGKELVGVQGLIPLSQFDDRLPGNQIFLALWKVLEDRGIGIGLRLYKNIVKEYQPEFIGSVGIESRAVPFHEWQGFVVGTMDHHVVLRGKRISREKNPAVSFQKITQKELQGLETEPLYRHQRPLKSDTYLINRFMKHPVYHYDLYAIMEESRLRALCVVRPIRHEGKVFLRLVDFIGPNEAVPLLGDFAAALLERYDAESIDLYSHGIPASLLRDAGLINRRETEGLIVPNYFEPFENKNVDLIFGHKASPAGPIIRLFKADGDQDRPNQIQEKNECLKN
jgi:hypothetical protein